MDEDILRLIRKIREQSKGNTKQAFGKLLKYAKKQLTDAYHA